MTIQQLLLRLKWSFKKYASTLTIIKLLVLGVIVWALGVMCWIIPGTYERISQLKAQNEQLNHYLAKVKTTTRVQQVSTNIKPELLTNIQLYKEVFGYVKETNTNLLEYQEIHSKNLDKFQFSVSGSWLDTRLLLGKIQTNSDGYIINSIDFQRNKKDNSVNVTVLLQGKELQ
ncbi:hypothetical protein [Acinetobacter calcoaceticus]|uniref:hypothetical protein n=1 Tax=Acinetobacter calcoaceticus TaxID=471 RepID=UPI0002CF82E9|nr:hypothetical protein [Acinetobacter calcoaceticus]ENU08464.1 hypothetical protein F997_01910 [Acinetobacter calcoaceticus NIPH 13]